MKTVCKCAANVAESKTKHKIYLQQAEANGGGGSGQRAAGADKSLCRVNNDIINLVTVGLVYLHIAHTHT